MTRCELYSPRGKWTVHVFLDIKTSCTDEIMEALFYSGIDGMHAKQAYENLTRGEINSGLCYSNHENRESVVVIGKTSSASEAFNSIMHEFAHLAAHIANADGLDNSGETIAYTIGELSHDLWKYIRPYLCDCYRDKLYHERTHGEDHGFGVNSKGGLIAYYE